MNDRYEASESMIFAILQTRVRQGVAKKLWILKSVLIRKVILIWEIRECF